MIAGCPTHRVLVERALGPDASDADLALYAEVVPGCAACQRLLLVGARVHPGYLHREQPDEHEAIAARVALDDAGVERLMQALEPAVRSWKPVLAVVVLAVAAVLLWWVQPTPIPRAPHGEAPIQVANTGPDQVAGRHEATVEPPRTPAPAAPLDDAVADAVADAVDDADPAGQPAGDWAPPPFVDLRGASSKGPGVRDLRLAFDGTPAVGEAVRLVVQSSSSELVSVCVEGVENGVVWRGAVPGGRTVLTLDERAVRYRFPLPGAYRFALALGDACAPAVHRVQVSL